MDAITKSAAAPANLTADTRASSYDGVAQIEILKQAEQQGRIGRLQIVNSAKICAGLGSSKIQNVVLLGTAVALGALPFSSEQIVAVLSALVKPEFVELNLKAFAAGQEIVQRG